MQKKIVGLLGAVAVASTAAVAGVMASDSPAPTPAARTGAAQAQTVAHSSARSSSLNGPISRSEIISRAAYWYKHRSKIPYNWNGTYRDPDGRHKYRRDCSGFVSMALHISPTGLSAPSTVNLPNYGVKLSSRKKMKKGDYTGVLGAGTGGAAGHVRIFEAWANSSHTVYWAYDFGSTPVKHQKYSLKGDKPRGGHGWTAYRYKKVTG